jgi:hypothetical protein
VFLEKASPGGDDRGIGGVRRFAPVSNRAYSFTRERIRGVKGGHMHATIRKRLFFAALVAACAGLATGCHSVPSTRRAAALDDLATFTQAAPRYWGKKGAACPSSTKRIAIVEFSVDYVSEKLLSPSLAQPTFGGIDYTTEGFILTTIGFWRTKTAFDEPLKSALPTEMYEIFVRELERRGYSVVPLEEVRRAEAYSRLAAEKPGASSLWQWLSVVTTDTGNAKKMQVYPAEGLVTIRNANGAKVEDVEAALASEVGADACIRARFRVGLYDRRATVERGSRIFIWTPMGGEELWASTSLQSYEQVADKGEFKAFQGRVHTVDSAKYREAIGEIFPVFVDMALIRMK